MASLRNTQRRNRFRKIIAKGEPPCGICGDPIDYTAPHRDPLSFTIDHITPISLGGDDTLDNLRPAHWQCNCERQAEHPLPTGVRYVTARQW